MEARNLTQYDDGTGILGKVMDKQETLTKAYGELCRTLQEINGKLGNIETNTGKIDDALRNGIVDKIGTCVEKATDRLYWRFSGTIAIIVASIGAVMRFI
jgi:hypothetical protein